MTKRIFKSIFLAAFCVLLASLVIITGCLYEYYSKTFENQMRDELDLAAAAVDISCVQRWASIRVCVPG